MRIYFDEENNQLIVHAKQERSICYVDLIKWIEKKKKKQTGQISQKKMKTSENDNHKSSKVYNEGDESFSNDFL